MPLVFNGLRATPPFHGGDTGSNPLGDVSPRIWPFLEPSIP